MEDGKAQVQDRTDEPTEKPGLTPVGRRLLFILAQLELIPASGFGQVEITFRNGRFAGVKTTETRTQI